MAQGPALPLAAGPLRQAQWSLMAANFAIGCGVMVVAGAMNNIVQDLRISVALGGQLVTIGAVVVGADGAVLAEAWCNTTETGDCTGHAETTAVRLASPQHGREALARATLYSSAEPCVMCAGAIFWSNIGRVVYGIDAVRLRHYRGERLDQRDAELSCRDVFAAAPVPITCIGPVLADEAAAVHAGAWKS